MIYIHTRHAQHLPVADPTVQQNETWTDQTAHPRWERLLLSDPLKDKRQVLCFSSSSSDTHFSHQRQLADLGRADRLARGEH